MIRIIMALHCSDMIMSAMASQITSVSIVCSTVCSGAGQIKHQSSASMALVRGIQRWPAMLPHSEGCEIVLGFIWVYTPFLWPKTIKIENDIYMYVYIYIYRSILIFCFRYLLYGNISISYSKAIALQLVFLLRLRSGRRVAYGPIAPKKSLTTDITNLTLNLLTISN